MVEETIARSADSVSRVCSLHYDQRLHALLDNRDTVPGGKNDQVVLLLTTAREASPVVFESIQCTAFHKTTSRPKHCFDQAGESFSFATNRSGDGDAVLQDKMPRAWHPHSYGRWKA